MDVSREDASRALDEIEAAGRRVRQVAWYREASPYLIAWGLVWMVGYAVTDLRPSAAGLAWLVAVSLGVAFTVLLTLRQMRMRAEQHALAPVERARRGRSMLLLGIALAGFFPAMFTVIGPLSSRQHGAFIALFWAFAYMAAGAWVGLRLFITGLVTAAAILVGYVFLPAHFALWMAVVGGGSLVSAGLWFRKI